MCENKPNSNPKQSQSNPIPEKPKMKLNSYSTKDYENKPRSNPGKTNPIKPNQTQFVVSKVEPPVVSLPVLSLPVVSLSNQSKGSNLSQKGGVLSPMLRRKS